MGKIHPGATLTPHFRDFLPPWVARQPWYRGTGPPALTPVGYFRFEDPDGEVGVETHLVAAGSVLYQLPMTYRGAPLDRPDALIATAEHSVLGTRWIYDGEADPVWAAELLRLVRTESAAEPSGKRGVEPAGARGRLLGPVDGWVRIELRRVVEPGLSLAAGVVGQVTGSWCAAGGTPEQGCLAVVRPERKEGGAHNFIAD